MNINSSNYWSASAASSKGMSGMISGMDTESMVEQMLAGTQKKIDAQLGLKQQTLWRQEIYRDMIQTINDFRTKFFNSSFDASASMNFASQAFFNSMKAAIKSGSGINIVGADSTALAGDIRVKVDQLAKEAELKSQEGHTVSSNSITGEAIDTQQLSDALSKQLTFKMKKDNSSVDVTVDLSSAKTSDDIAKAINDAMSNAGFSDVKVANDGGLLVFKIPKGSKSVMSAVEGSQLAKKLAGVSGVKSVDTAEGKTIRGTRAMDPHAALEFDVTLDGITKSIKLDNLSGSPSMDDVARAVTEKLDLTFGKGVMKAENSGGSLKFSFGEALAGEKGHSFRLTGKDLNELGIRPGASSQVSASTKLADLPGVSGGYYEFSINGVDFKFDSTQTVGEMMDTINSSGAGVKISYSSLADQFVMKSSSTGKNFKIEIKQKTGNLLTKMFGDTVVNPAANAATEKLTTGSIVGTKLTQEFLDANIRFTVDGKEYVFSLPKQTEGDGDDKTDKPYTPDEFAQKFQEFLDENFEGDLTYDKETGALKAKHGYQVSIQSAKMSAKKDEPAINLGWDGKSNAVTGSTKISELSGLTDGEKQKLIALAGKDADNATLADLNGKNDDIKFENGHLVVTEKGKNDYLNETLKDAVFGNGEPAPGMVQAGQDAIVTINGVQTTRSSNTFTIDGVTMELTATTETETVIGVSRDIDSIVEGFKEFVKDYNAMVEKLNGYVDEKAEYRKYPPLTDAQKKEMSDREIELWEEKAKKGLVRRDSIVEDFLSDMRTALYSTPKGCRVALYDIGLETSDYKQQGKLTLDESALRRAIADDPGAVEQLFTQAKDGLASIMEKALKDVANPSFSSPGALVELAGVKGYATEDNNTLTRRLNEIEGKIKDLQKRYEKEKNRYWNQFNKMEKILANLNSQSMSIQSQFMMGY